MTTIESTDRCSGMFVEVQRFFDPIHHLSFFMVPSRVETGRIPQKIVEYGREVREQTTVFHT